MAYLPSINNLTGSKPQGYTVPNKNTGKPVRIEVAKSAALKKKTAPLGSPGNLPRQYGDKGYVPSNGRGVGY